MPAAFIYLEGMKSMANVNFNKSKVFEIIDLAVAFLALIFGIFWMLEAVGFRFASQVSGPLSSGVLGFVVGLVFLIYALRFFRVIH